MRDRGRHARAERERERDGDGGTEGRDGEGEGGRVGERARGWEREHVEGRHNGLQGSEWCARDGGEQAGSGAGGQRM